MEVRLTVLLKIFKNEKGTQFKFQPSWNLYSLLCLSIHLFCLSFACWRATGPRSICSLLSIIFRQSLISKQTQPLFGIMDFFKPHETVRRSASHFGEINTPITLCHHSFVAYVDGSKVLSCETKTWKMSLTNGWQTSSACHSFSITKHTCQANNDK